MNALVPLTKVPCAVPLRDMCAFVALEVRAALPPRNAEVVPGRPSPSIGKKCIGRLVRCRHMCHAIDVCIRGGRLPPLTGASDWPIVDADLEGRINAQTRVKAWIQQHVGHKGKQLPRTNTALRAELANLGNGYRFASVRAVIRVLVQHKVMVPGADGSIQWNDAALDAFQGMVAPARPQKPPALALPVVDMNVTRGRDPLQPPPPAYPHQRGTTRGPRCVPTRPRQSTRTHVGAHGVSLGRRGAQRLTMQGRPRSTRAYSAVGCVDDPSTLEGDTRVGRRTRRSTRARNLHPRAVRRCASMAEFRKSKKHRVKDAADRRYARSKSRVRARDTKRERTPFIYQKLRR